VYCFGLNIVSRISFTLVKSLVKNTGRFEQGDSRCKMAGVGFHSIAILRGQIRNHVIADRSALQADFHKGNGCTADCYSQWSEFEDGMPQA
jgi:hypothetical protein